MKKQEFYYAMESCDIHNQLSDTKNNCYYKWKDADLVFIIDDEIEESVSVKVLGEISNEFITDFKNKFPDNSIIVSEVFDEKDNDNKYVSYVVIHNLKDILEFVCEMKIYLTKDEREKLDENDNSTNIEEDTVPDKISAKNNYIIKEYEDIFENPDVRRRIAEERAKLPIRGRWAQTVRIYNLEKKKKQREARLKRGRPSY